MAAKHAWVILVDRVLTLLLALAASAKHQSGDFRATAPDLLSFALGLHMIAGVLEVICQVTAIVKGFAPVPSRPLSYLGLFTLDLVLGVFTFASAAGTVAVADIAPKLKLVSEPSMARDLFMQGVLAFAAGVSSLATTFYTVFPAAAVEQIADWIQQHLEQHLLHQ